MIYVPLEIKGDKFVGINSPIEPTAWFDKDFVCAFERQLADNFRIIVGTVIMSGAEFSSCMIFSPKEGIKDHHYARIQAGAPVRAGEPQVAEPADLPEASIEALQKELDEVGESEKFYEELRTTLSNNYLPPNYAFESEPEQRLFSTVDLLRYSRILIVGPPGSGKTSLVRRLAFDLHSKLLDDPHTDRLACLYFKLRDFDNNAFDLSKAITRKEENIGHDFVPVKSRRGQLLYIFDGFDELNVDRRAGFATWLSGFTAKQISVRIIITSREISDLSGEIFSEFRKLAIKPFSASQIHEYCQRYFGSKKSADQFFEQIAGNASLTRLLSNPLTLSLSLALYAVRKLLPYNTGELVQQIVLHLTERWDEKRGINRYRLLSARSVRSLLGRLAYRLQVQGNFTFDESVLIGLIPFELSKISGGELLDEVRSATGLLRYEDRKWSFGHRYLQDFFCAAYIIERVGGVQNEYHKFNSDKSWATVWRYVGELCSDPESYIGFAKGDNKGPVYPLDKLMAILLSEDRVGNEALALLLDVARKNLKLLAGELHTVVVSKSRIAATLNEDAPSDVETLASFLLNFYHLSKLPQPELAFKLYRAVKSTKLGNILEKLIASDQVPKIAVVDGRMEINFNKSKSKESLG